VTKNSLFRLEVLQKRSAPRSGAILIVRPTSFKYITAVACICAVAVLAFLIFGTYAMRSVASGQLVPTDGVVKVMSPVAGLVLESRIGEGQHVNKGDILFVLSGERQYSDKGFSQAGLSDQLRIRKQSLQDDVARMALIHREQDRALRRQIEDLSGGLSRLEAQVNSKKARLALSQTTIDRYQDLFEQHYISNQQLQEKQADFLDTKAGLQALDREYVSAKREIDDAHDALRALPLKQERELESIRRSIALVEQDLIDSEGRRQIVIAAQIAGIATTQATKVGQTAEPGRPLVNIVPDHSLLEARLYVPGKAIGFVKQGDIVMLRYQAYPYQKFGHAQGIVKTVGRVAVPIAELGEMAGNTSTSTAETVYAVTVELKKQTVLAYGHHEILMPGMQVDGDILHESRNLLEWVLDPVYTITGRM
jgi:membrane fusion protein